MLCNYTTLFQGHLLLDSFQFVFKKWLINHHFQIIFVRSFWKNARSWPMTDRYFKPWCGFGIHITRFFKKFKWFKQLWMLSSKSLIVFKNECTRRVFCISTISSTFRTFYSLTRGEDGAWKSAKKMNCKDISCSFSILSFLNCEFDWSQIWQPYRK